MSKILDHYYPSHKNNTYYALYSPAIQRFLLVDCYNIFAFFKTAQVLSSKINTVVVILPANEKHPIINNDNCLQFTFFHTKFQDECGGNNLKQSPTAIFLNSTKIIKTIPMADFDIEERKEKILELQQYAKYVNSCMHAIMLTSIIYQQIYQEIEQSEYESFYFNTQCDPTLVTNIMNILSFANNIIEAKEQIKNFWLKLLNENIIKKIYYPEKLRWQFSNHCKKFYEILEIEIPTEIQHALDNAKL